MYLEYVWKHIGCNFPRVFLPGRAKFPVTKLLLEKREGAVAHLLLVLLVCRQRSISIRVVRTGR